MSGGHRRYNIESLSRHLSFIFCVGAPISSLTLKLPISYVYTALQMNIYNSSML